MFYIKCGAHNYNPEHGLANRDFVSDCGRVALFFQGSAVADPSASN